MKYAFIFLIQFIIIIPLAGQSNKKVARIHQLKLENKDLESEVLLLEKKISELRQQIYTKRNKQRNNRHIIYNLENELYGVVSSFDEREEQESIESEEAQKELVKKREQEEAERKRRKEEERRAMESRNRVTGAFSGNQGYVTGDTGSRARMAFGTNKSGNGFDLRGRSLVGSLPYPSFSYKKEGIVVIKIIVDRNGNVTSAEFQLKGSNTQDRELIENAKAAARRAKFNADKSASAYAQGTITYHFQLD